MHGGTARRRACSAIQPPFMICLRVWVAFVPICWALGVLACGITCGVPQHASGSIPTWRVWAEILMYRILGCIISATD